MTEANGGVWYAGHANGTVTVMEGTDETPLPHHVKHSPTGFAWGFGGSGPSELARCLLLHALGEARWCKACEGTGQIVFDEDGKELSVADAEANLAGAEWTEAVVTCSHCEDGCAVMPAMYQQFKFDVVAKLTNGMSWTMPQAEVLDWYRRYVIREAQAGGIEIVTPEEFLAMRVEEAREASLKDPDE